MKNLERRVQKIEGQMSHLACPNPAHERLWIFIYGVTPEKDRENDELIESIENCEHCNDELIMLVMHGPDHPSSPPVVSPASRQEVSFEFEVTP